jgi:hypothetical protein
MRHVIWGLLLAGFSVSLTGCGGGALSESDLRRMSRKRAPEEEQEPPRLAAAIAPAATAPEPARAPEPGSAPTSAQAARNELSVEPPTSAPMRAANEPEPPAPSHPSSEAEETAQKPTATPVQVAAAPAPDPVTPAAPLPVETTSAPSPAEPVPPAAAPPSVLLGGGASAANLIPVPPEEELAEARELFRELFGEQYSEARTWEEKAKLAAVLMAEASKVEKNPAHYHELLRITRDVAVGGGDATTALKAVNLLTQRFQVDGMTLRLKLLEDFAKSPRKTGAAETLRKEALDLLLDAFDADNFDVALPAYERLVEYTRIKGDRGEVTRLAQRKQPLEAARQAYVAASAAAETLEDNPDDAEASETLGKYLCFVKNRWPDGLPHLVRAAVVKLRVVARIDLEAGRSPQDSLSLADQYWEMAGDYKQPFSRGLHLRAARYYQLAQNSLPDGLEKLKAQKRIEEAGDIYGKDVVARALASGGAGDAAESE